MARLKPLSEQVVVITGATSGIGLAVARQAAAASARVFLIARSASTLAPIVEDIAARGGVAAYASADVGDPQALAQAAQAALERFGRIDTWISNAGVAIYSDLLATPRDEHERLFQTNYWGAVNSAEVAIPHLRASQGALIVVGSIASDMGSPVMGAYAASKHAVKGYIDSLRIELNRDKVPVTVTLVRPSGIDTPLNTHVANHMGGRPKIPPPVYSPDLVAATILHAAVSPIREVTVGGVGIAQVLVATHLPAAFAKLAGLITPLLNDPDKPNPEGENLFSAGSSGRTHGDGGGRRFSLYTSARLRPLGSTSGLIVGLTAAALLLARSRRGKAHQR